MSFSFEVAISLSNTSLMEEVILSPSHRLRISGSRLCSSMQRNRSLAVNIPVISLSWFTVIVKRWFEKIVKK